MIKVESPKYYWELEQNTPEWLKARLGIITASEVNSIVTPKGAIKTGKGVDTYRNQKVSEIVTGRIADHFESYAMMKGHIGEVYAIESYSENYAPTQSCGFITREIEGVTIGASPDAIVGEDGGCEVKTLMPHLHVQTILADAVPEDHINQIQTTLLVSGRKWWDYIQFQPGMSLFVKRVLPDPVRQELIIKAVKELNVSIDASVKKYNGLASKLVPTEFVDMNIGTEKEIQIGEQE